MTGARDRGSRPGAAMITEPLSKVFPPPGLVPSWESGCCPALFMATLEAWLVERLEGKGFQD